MRAVPQLAILTWTDILLIIFPLLRTSQSQALAEDLYRNQCVKSYSLISSWIDAYQKFVLQWYYNLLYCYILVYFEMCHYTRLWIIISSESFSVANLCQCSNKAEHSLFCLQNFVLSQENPSRFDSLHAREICLSQKPHN